MCIQYDILGFIERNSKGIGYFLSICVTEYVCVCV